jgi:ABC-type branched-subunit amino acid transport system ATPase component
VRDRPAAATSLGVRGEPLLLGAFAGSAAVAGLAGSLAVQLAGVTDPGAFGPVVSFKLLAAVLLGGASYAVSGIAGVAVLGAIALVARAWAHLQAGSAADVEPLFAAILLLVVLALRPERAPLLERLRARVLPAGPRLPVSPARSTPPVAAHVVLSARGLVKHYGGVRALDGFDLEVGDGETVALVGANGSGKTTALRVLAGAVPLDAGELELDGLPVTGQPAVELASAGVVRTLQRTATFGTLTALESAVVGASLHARHSGAFRSLASTPKSRAEARELRAAALDALQTVRLEQVADVPAARLDGFQQRRLMLAAALAARPRLLLLDEPSAGAARAEVDGLLEILAAIREGGVTLVVVEHDQRLVRTLADRVVVMADGKTLPG